MIGGRGAALFLDRDGTIIVDVGYIGDPADVVLIEGAGEAIAAAATRGYMVVVVSNQSGVGRGLISAESVADVDRRMRSLLGAYGVTLAGSYYCPHDPSAECACRKPNTGLLVEAAHDLDISFEQSVMVGDRWSDVAAGHAAGCRVNLALGFGPPPEATARIESLRELGEYLDAIESNA